MKNKTQTKKASAPETRTESAIRIEQQRETARSINRQANALQASSGFGMGPVNKPIEMPKTATAAPEAPDSEGRDQEFGPNWREHFPAEG